MASGGDSECIIAVLLFTQCVCQTPARLAREAPPLLPVNKSSSGEQVRSLQQAPRKGETGTTGKSGLQSRAETDWTHQSLRVLCQQLHEPHLKKVPNLSVESSASRLASPGSTSQLVALGRGSRGGVQEPSASSEGSFQTAACLRGPPLHFSRWLFSLKLNWPTTALFIKDRTGIRARDDCPSTG